MSMSEKRRFKTTGDGGRFVTVVEYQHWSSFQPLSGPAERAPAGTELFTVDGLDVTPIGGGKFKIVLTDEILTPL